MTSYMKFFVLIDFHFQDAIFPIQPRGAVRHDERGSEGAKPNEREERGVCYFIADKQHCATPSVSLDDHCSAGRHYRCAWRARSRRPHRCHL